MTRRHYAFDAIGTRWQISANSDLSEDGWLALQEDIATRIDRFDKDYSRFRVDSLVSKISRRAGDYQLPPDGPKLMQFYEKLYRATSGLVTPLIGQVMADAGYDAVYSFRVGQLSVPPSWEEAIELSGGQLRVKRSVLLDFGAAGKGYLVDIIALLMAGHGLTDFLINAGGDILHRGASGQTVRVGLENPLDHSQALGAARLGNASLCASSGSRRKWGKYHHIFNPRTLESAAGVIATWVMARDTMTADGLATALFFTDPKPLCRNFKFEYAVLEEDMSIRRSAGFPAEFFTKEQP